MKALKLTALFVVLAIVVLSFVGCKNTSTNNDNKNSNTTSTITNNYTSITPEEAKSIMDNYNEYVILDVRTQEEYDEGHIKGAILIPDYEIEQRAENEILNKDELILVYCRSGRRSKLTSQKLADLGYTNVKEFGGISQGNYEIVK